MSYEQCVKDKSECSNSCSTRFVIFIINFIAIHWYVSGRVQIHVFLVSSALLYEVTLNRNYSCLICYSGMPYLKTK